jgi:hypothetical protein
MGGVAVLSGATPAGASPTNVYVSSYGSDTNPCSSSSPCLTLAHAYSAVATGGTINLAGGTYKGGLDITKNVNIVGPSSDGSLDVNTATIDALNGNNGIFVNGQTVSISDVVIDGVNNTTGDGIDNDGGTLTLTNVVIENNVVHANGGGLYNDVGGKITMTGGSLLENSATDTDGGGLFNLAGATVTLKNVSLNHNTGAEGGGIYNKGTVHLTGTTSLHNNSATLDGGGIEKCGGSVTATSGVSNTANIPNDIGTLC